MLRRMRMLLVAGVVALGLSLACAAPAQAQNYTMDRFFYYPYYYFPHNYWPANSPVWPERPGEPYRAPPAYMAYPPFMDYNWRFPICNKMSYYRGFHFWLDAF